MKPGKHNTEPNDQSATGPNTLALEQLRQELAATLQALGDKLAADVLTLFLYDPVADQFDLPIGFGLRDPASFMNPQMLPRTDRVAGRIVKSQRPIIANQVLDHVTMDGPFARREKIVASAGFPLIHENASVGVLFASFRRAHIFSEAEQREIEMAAEHAAEIITQADLFPALRAQRADVHSSEKQTFEAIVSLACNVMKLPAAIWLLDSQKLNLQIRASTGLTDAYVTTATTHIDDEDLIAQVARSGKMKFVPDLYADPRFRYVELARQAGWVSSLAYPVGFRGRTGAVIQVFTFKPHEFSQEELATLARLADIASVATENTHRSREAQMIAQVARTLSSTPDFGRAMEVIVDSALEMTGADSSVIVLLEQRTDSFTVGCRRPLDKPPTLTPRSTGGLTRHLVNTGEPVKIDDTLEDNRVSDAVKLEGIRSLAGVRVQLEEERIGALFVDGFRKGQFSDYEIRLLQTLANQASVALGWARRLRIPQDEIEKANSRLVHLETVIDDLCKNIQSSLGFEYAAVQLIRPEDNIIETIHGTGVAKQWSGRARHYLEQDAELRDIQTDIALTGNTEITSGQDERFDRWLYDEYKHSELIRVFTPIVLVRDERDRVIDNWYEHCQWTVVDEKGEPGKQHTIIKMELASEQSQENGLLSIDIIGTVEAGYRKDSVAKVESQQAIALARLVSKGALDIRQALLPHVLETVVYHAMHIVGADSASLHYLYNHDQAQYIYEVCSGDITREFLKTHRPRPKGLGRDAIKARMPKFLPDRSQGHEDLDLEKINPTIYQEGIRAIAAFPLLVGPDEGVLYIHFRQLHRFTEDEIGWVQLFAQRAVDAIRDATTYAQMRDKARQLTTLHSVSQSLASAPDDSDLLDSIAWNTLNLLAADVVTIYGYLETEKLFMTPPEIAGRIKVPDEMDTGIAQHDAPASIVEAGRNIYAERSSANDILSSPARKRPPEKEAGFVEREKIVSSAGILLQVGTETVGVMFINFRRPHIFSTEEKQVIETLASAAAIAIKNRRFLETLINVEREIITTLDLRKLLTLILQRAVEITGADRGDIRLLDLIGQELEVQVRHPAKEKHDANLNRMPVNQGVTGWVASNRQSALVANVRKDPRYLAYFPDMRAELCVPLVRGDGRILGVLNVESRRREAFDRTDQRRLEALANQAVVAMQNAENKRRRVAAETMTTIGDMAGSLIHRMNNDVGAIRTLALSLKQAQGIGRKDKQMATEIQSLAEKVIQEAQELKGWILEPARPIDPCQAVAKALEWVRIPRKIDVINQLSEVLDKVPGGDQQMTDVFINLIQNAVDAMPKGGSLTIGGKKALSNGDSWVIMWVSDTGHGIREEDLAKIFEPTFTTKHSSKGLGFGLWWTRTYIERLEGMLGIKSVPGEGTAVTIMLPAFDSEP